MIPAFVAHHPHAFAVALVFEAYLIGMALVGYLARRAHLLARAIRAPRTAARAVERYRRGIAYDRAAGTPAGPRHARTTTLTTAATSTISDARKAATA